MRKYISFILFICIILSSFIVVQGAVFPSISKNEVSVKVGSTVNVPFSYGDSSTKVEIVVTNLRVDAYITGNILYLKGISEGSSYVTLEFNDGSSHTVKVNVLSKYGSGNANSDIEIVKGYSKSVYIDLDSYSAKKATITYDSDYITLNKTTFTSSGDLRITGKKIGEGDIKIKYDTGDVEYIYFDVVSESYNNNLSDIELGLYKNHSFYIDLDYYDADSATISYDSNYVDVNKTRFTYSGNLNIEGLKVGYTEIRIKYDTGEIQYLNIEILKTTVYDPYISVDDLEVVKGETESIYVYLNGVSKATLSTNNSNISLSQTTLYSNSSVKITGNTVGVANLKVVFSDGTSYIIPVTIKKSNYIDPSVVLSTKEVVVGEKTLLTVNSGDTSGYITITVSNPEKMELDLTGYSKYTKTYTFYLSQNKTKEIEIKGIDAVNDAYISTKFSNNVTEKTILSVINYKPIYADGYSKTGDNFKLNRGIGVDTQILAQGYISGYTDGTFRPLSSITREEFGVMLARIINSDGKAIYLEYPSDVTAQWSKDSIAKLVSLGIISSKDLYRPTDNITRYEVVEMLYNVIDLSGYSEYSNLSDLSNNSIDKKIAQCYNAGIVSGYPDNTFKGQNTISRAEVVALLNRVFYKDINTYKTNIFSDVEKGYWAYSNIIKASKI